MTFDDDFIQIQFDGGTRRLFCKQHGIEWPPPDVLELQGFKFKLVSRSQISDDDRKTMTHVCRGAAYEPAAAETP